jgi:hypothetical protein
MNTVNIPGFTAASVARMQQSGVREMRFRITLLLYSGYQPGWSPRCRPTMTVKPNQPKGDVK